MNISYSEKRKYFLLAAVKQDVTSLKNIFMMQVLQSATALCLAVPNSHL